MVVFSAQWSQASDNWHKEVSGANIGHRVGAGKGERNSHLPENSLIALRAALLVNTLGRKVHAGVELPIQFLPEFRYLEFDIQETRDGELVLFHDRTLARMIPYHGENQKKLDRLAKELGKSSGRNVDPKKIKISHLTVNQLQTLDLNGIPGEKVPTLREFLTAALHWGLVKPITLEIKYLKSDKARETLIAEAARFRDLWLQKTIVEFSPRYDLDPSGVGFLSFPAKFSANFGKKGSPSRFYWCQRFKHYGFERVYRTIFHSVDLCSK